MKKISIITSTRAEYGLLKRLIKKFQADNDSLLDLIVTGSHLQSYYGNTEQEIIDDGFINYTKIPINIVINQLLIFLK